MEENSSGNGVIPESAWLASNIVILAPLLFFLLFVWNFFLFKKIIKKDFCSSFMYSVIFTSVHIIWYYVERYLLYILSFAFALSAILTSYFYYHSTKVGYKLLGNFPKFTTSTIKGYLLHYAYHFFPDYFLMLIIEGIKTEVFLSTLILSFLSFVPDMPSYFAKGLLVTIVTLILLILKYFLVI